MTEDMVKCPKDTKIMYQRDVCENIFRKGNLRCWCTVCLVGNVSALETETVMSAICQAFSSGASITEAS